MNHSDTARLFYGREYRASAAAMTIAEIDRILTRLAEMTRQELVDEIRNFAGPFRLDFSDQFLASATTDQLRHILMAAYLQCRRHAADASVPTR